MNKSEIYKLMAMVTAEFGNRFVVTTDKVELWMGILGHANFAECSKAVAQILGSARQFPPTVGEINQQVLQQRAGTTGLDWGAEWQKALRAAANSSYNAQGEAAKLSPATLSAIGGIAGLKEIAALPAESLTAIRAQFRQRYEAQAIRSTEKEFQNYIEGSAKKLIDSAVRGAW